MFKKIKILGAIALSLIANHTFAANTDIELSTNESKVALNSAFDVNFSMNLDSGTNLDDFTMDGIDKFTEVGKSSSFAFQSVNGVNKSVYTITYKLMPKEKGKFTLGPVTVKLGNKTMKSNTISIEVGDATNQIINQNQLQNQVPTQNLNQQPPQANNTTGDHEITDINDIIGQKEPSNGFGFLWIILAIIFFGAFYYITKYYLDFKDDKKITLPKLKKEKEIVKEPSKTDYFLEKLEIIKRNSNLYNKSEFFSNVNDLLREILEYKGLKQARNMTLQELKKADFDKKIIKLIEKTYFEEFKKEEIDINRLDIIDEIKELII
ncbi:MAG: BatD family protein [Candidatus Gracilibacteria bacterium]|nr:BatD family protein [Candidatus Gracilibacteria bacterium]